MAVSELTNELSLKVTLFEVSIIVSIYVKFPELDIWSSVLKIEHTPGLVLTSRV